MPASQEYLQLLEEMRELHVRKSTDYGIEGDPLANCKGSEQLGVPAWIGTMIRAQDKMVRIRAFITNGSLANESVEDSLMDLAAYSLIALVLMRQSKAKSKLSEVVNQTNKLCEDLLCQRDLTPTSQPPRERTS